MSPAFYAKNVPMWERAIRILVSLAVVVVALSLASPWNWVVAASAVGFAVTGLVGFCPACAMVGRRLGKEAP